MLAESGDVSSSLSISITVAHIKKTLTKETTLMAFWVLIRVDFFMRLEIFFRKMEGENINTICQVQQFRNEYFIFILSPD